MPHEDKINFLEGSLGNEEFTKKIGEDPKQRADFISTLEAREASPEYLLNLIEITKDIKVRSLLIFHLLCQKDYLSRLSGDSILTSISEGKQDPSPSRLNALMYQMDISILNDRMIKKLTPEAAISLLCSVPHFHQLTSDQVHQLLHHRLESDLISYWLRHYSFMPNAHNVLSHLMTHVYHTVIEAIKKNTQQEPAIINNIITHLHLFSSASLQHIYKLPLKESHLNLAMQLYINGHYYTTYTELITHMLCHKLKNQHFSKETIALLFSLNNVLELKAALQHHAHLLNNYLKINAVNGTNTPFNREGVVYTAQMMQEIYHPNAENDPTDNEESEKLSYINARSSDNNPLNCFEYFLIHSHGNNAHLDTLLQAYLAELEKQKNPGKKAANLSKLLNMPILNDAVKKEVFTALLDHPRLFDEQVNADLFLYHAENTVKHFGLQGGEKNYQQVLSLCNSALKKNHPPHEEHIRSLAEQALSEAEFELIQSTQQGWFYSVLKHAQRCWFYGLEHFLVPKKPIYVCPEFCFIDTADSESLKINTEAHPNLPALLRAPQSLSTPEECTNIINALTRYGQQNPIRLTDEFSTRLKLHQLVTRALLSGENEELTVFLHTNKTPFLHNQFRLVELALIDNSLEKAKACAQQIDNDQTNFLKLVAVHLEDAQMPDLNPKSTEKPLEISQQVEALVDKAADTVLEAAASVFTKATQVSGTLAGGVSQLVGWGATFFPPSTPPTEPVVIADIAFSPS